MILERKEVMGCHLLDRERLKWTLWIQEVLMKSDSMFESALRENNRQNLSLSLHIYFTLDLLKPKLDSWMQRFIEILGLKIKELIEVSSSNPSEEGSQSEESTTTSMFWNRLEMFFKEIASQNTQVK